MDDETFPVARLGRLLTQNTHTVYRDVRHARYGVPFKVAGRWHVRVDAIERAAGKHFTYGELRRARLPQPPLNILDVQLATTIEIFDNLGEFFNREQVLAVAAHNIGLRDIQWQQYLKKYLEQTAFPEKPTIPDRDVIANELDELKHNGGSNEQNF
jgi:hypothetical protein